MRILTFKNAVTDDDIRKAGEAKKFSMILNSYTISNIGSTISGISAAAGFGTFINGSPDERNLAALIVAGGISLLIAFGMGNSTSATYLNNLKERKILRVAKPDSLNSIEQSENANKFSETLHSFFSNNIMTFLSSASLFLANSVAPIASYAAPKSSDTPNIILGGLMIGLGVLGNMMSYRKLTEKKDYLNNAYQNIGEEEKVK